MDSEELLIEQMFPTMFTSSCALNLWECEMLTVALPPGAQLQTFSQGEGGCLCVCVVGGKEGSHRTGQVPWAFVASPVRRGFLSLFHRNGL